MKRFAELFKKYRLRAEFDTFSAFSEALAEKGYFYEESIFSHWQKGTRTPTDRKLVLSIITIFVDRQAIRSTEEADDFLASAGLGYLTLDERKKLNVTIKTNMSPIVKRNIIYSSVLLMSILILSILASLFYLNVQQQKNYVTFPKTVPSAVTEPKKLVIGIDATLEPMEFIENEKLQGFDVDLGIYLANELDADVEYRNIMFDNLFNALDQRQINMIISAVTITEERKEKYDFSVPYLNAGQVIITKIENRTIKNVGDLKGKKIATQTGTTNEKEALKHTSDKNVIRFPDFVQATQAIVDGRADALFTDLPNAKGIISKHPQLKIVREPFTEEYYGIVFIKGDPSVEQINDALKILKQKGLLSELEKKWLKT